MLRSTTSKTPSSSPMLLQTKPPSMITTLPSKYYPSTCHQTQSSRSLSPEETELLLQSEAKSTATLHYNTINWQTQCLIIGEPSPTSTMGLQFYKRLFSLLLEKFFTSNTKMEAQNGQPTSTFYLLQSSPLAISSMMSKKTAHSMLTQFFYPHFC